MSVEYVLYSIMALCGVVMGWGVHALSHHLSERYVITFLAASIAGVVLHRIQEWMAH